MHDRALDGEPVWSPDGRWIYFSSDRTGIYNLYALDWRSKDLWQVTNVYGGAFSPDVSPDGTRLVYMGYDVAGFEIFELPVDAKAWLPAEPYVDDRPAPTDIPDDEAWVSAPRRYRPLETLAPNAYTVSLTADSFGSAATIQTNGSDIAGHHGWSLGATVGIERGDVSVGASYGYSRLWPSFRLALGRSVYRTGGLVVDNVNTAYTEESLGANVTMGLPVVRTPEFSSDVSIGYAMGWTRNLDPLPAPRPDGAVMRLPENGVDAGLRLGWSMSTVRRALFVPGPIAGWSLGTGLRYDHPDLGGDWQALELTYNWQQFWQMPWSREQTFAWRLRGGLEAASRRRDGPYGLGGLGTQNITQSILDGTRANTGVLRGYEPGQYRGRQFHLLNAEYRFQLGFIERGWVTLPFFLRRLHGAVLFDAGYARDGDFDWRAIKPTLGAALRLDAVFGFFEGGSFELGYARGLADDGRGEWWFLLTGGI
jgi:hypothetical protein